MPLRLEDKKAVVAEVAEVANQANLAIALDYRGLSVAQLMQLRSEARKQELYVRVVRNTLARRAVSDTEFACMSEHLLGPLMLVFSSKEPGDAARLVRDFIKKNDACEVKLLAMGGKLFDAAKLNAVAYLPTREQALGMLMSVMQAPVTKFVRGASETYAKLARALAAVRDQKQAS